VGRVAAVGEDVRLRGYALAGAELHAAAGEDELAAAWERLSDDVTCLVLTRAAHAALAARLRERPDLVWAVVPD
jgi:vacuolar-type H+-ATPase subunit F/Vma7